MFLDEELEQIYSAHKSESSNRGVELWKACTGRIPKNAENNPEIFINSLRQIDSSWQLFAKRHSDMNPNFFRTIILDHVVPEDNPELKAKLKSDLKW